MKTSVLPLAAGLFAFSFGPALHAAADVKLIPSKDRVRVEIGGQLFTEYVFGDGASRPYCYPILASDGTGLTRDFPMKKTPGEDTDHPWHRSFYFAHSFVNGVDFWNEAGGDAGKSPATKGNTVHDSFLETTSGAVGVLRAKTRWVAPDGKLVCTDERTLKFRPAGDDRIIDFEITLQAPANEPLLVGDNKDGTMAVRIAQWMTMPHQASVRGPDGKSTRQPTGGKGQIVTAKGDRGAAAWGKRAEWCDYHAEHNGKTYGIAIFDHPQNLRHPTWWMARDYGLFGANPFGWHDYEPEFKDQPHKGDVTVPAGGSLTLRYRFVFHYGDEKAAKLAERYAEYAAGK